MTIDINELRKVIADCYWPTSPVTINELLDRLEAAESECLEEARLNGMGSEREAALMAKLEAAEKERDDVAQQLVQSEIGKREISEAHDALQVEVGKLKDLEVARCVKINGYIVDNARLVEEVERLRAKIAEMEKQEPVAFALYSGWAFKAAYHKEHEACDQRDRRQLSADLGGSLEAYRVVPLYALPGAKGEGK